MAKKDESYNYDDAPKAQRFLYPNGYAKVEIESHEEVSSQAGNKGFVAVGRIVDAGKKGEQFEGNPVFLRFYVGHEDDPDAEDPKTWSKDNEAKGSKFAVAQLIKFLVACELTKGEGRGKPPWVLFDEVDGAELIVRFTKRTNKKTGEDEQNYDFFKVGDREPEMLGEVADGGKRKKREAEEEEEDERPTRRRREEDDEEEEKPKRGRLAKDEEEDEEDEDEKPKRKPRR